jgi:hypothetical protein
MRAQMGSQARLMPSSMKGFRPMWSEKVPMLGAQRKERMDVLTNWVQEVHVTACKRKKAGICSSWRIQEVYLRD